MKDNLKEKNKILKTKAKLLPAIIYMLFFSQSIFSFRLFDFSIKCSMLIESEQTWCGNKIKKKPTTTYKS